METSEKIIDYLKKKNQATASSLIDYLGISRVAVSKQLKKLLLAEKIYKIGKPPKVFYFLKDQEEPREIEEIDPEAKKMIEKNYLIITSSGERKEGLKGFAFWCENNNLPIKKTAKEYSKIVKKYQALKRNGLINGMEKFKNTFEKVCLDKAFYLDFYSIERFGKTKLGQLLLYAKQSQNKGLTKEIVEIIKNDIDSLIKKHKIKAIGFIPPTVKREIQFIKELEKQLNLNLPKNSILKLKTEIAVPQKTLNKLKDRIENAQKTIVVNESKQYERVLLLDDAIGSGATLNETAKKIKENKVAKEVVGLSITGSLKGFDVISEV
jgi:DNA-binding transcriptional ArsR family regulator/hypoxanthine-guanine phosphoribosyltransferase